MKSKREKLLGGNTRARLFLTLGLAVVLPALTLIYVNYQHVKSIQRDKKVEALIHRDFQYLLGISEKKMNQKVNAMIEQAKDQFPTCNDPEPEKRRKLAAILAESPWFAHVFLYDSENGIILEAQPGGMGDAQREDTGKMYSGWFGMEGHTLMSQMHKKRPVVWFAGETDEPHASTYTSTGLFTFPLVPKDRVLLGGVSFDPNYLKQTFFPEVFAEIIAQKPTDEQNGNFGEMFDKLTTKELREDQRLAMMVFPGEAGKWEYDRPFTKSDGWGAGKPEVAQNLDGPFRGLTLGIKFQGTTAEAISRRWVLQSFLILGVLSVLMIGGLVLTYRSVNKQVALARLKSDFVSNVSHELRTPLALIRLYAETLELGRITTQEKKHEYYGIIRKESERLTALINNILDFSRIEAGRKEYDFKETDIAELVRNTLDSYRYQIEQQGFAFEEQIDPGIPKVRVDREAIARALVNLVNNALKYSDSEKFLGVKLYREKELLKLEVVDRGIGIERTEQSRIFEKFYRTCDPLVHNTKGSGLGLSLVRHITHAHGGQVEVESTPGRGSKFTLSLPLAGAQPGTTGAA